MVEGCVMNPGLRLLLRFSVATANVGDVDMIMGRPAENEELFDYSECHAHYHFNGYAEYDLSSDGGVVAAGHKQAFCLMDTSRYIDDDPEVAEASRYNCRFQGISRGWQDVYGSHLDCQWIDVTDLDVGEYALSVRINRTRRVTELRYDNNDATVDIRVPAFDLAQPCGDDEIDGLRRSCGWSLREVGACEQGEMVEVGCGGCNGRGEACQGDPMMRVCEGEMTQCLRSLSLSESNNTCGTNCPQAQFMCPPSGAFTIWLNSNEAGEASQCVYEIYSAPPAITRACEGDEANGLERLCGWEPSLVNAQCLSGFEYRVGCNRNDEGVCGGDNQCEGDTMMRVCPGKTSCLSDHNLGQNDDSCGNRCSEVTFECPLQGRITAFTGSYRTGEDFRCSLTLERIGE
jgi:hypothetical protein